MLNRKYQSSLKKSQDNRSCQFRQTGKLNRLETAIVFICIIKESEDGLSDHPWLCSEWKSFCPKNPEQKNCKHGLWSNQDFCGV